MSTGDWVAQPGDLAASLRALRKDAGLTGTALAESIGQGWSASRVSKLENGRQTPTREDVASWAAACGHPELTAELVATLTAIEALHLRHRDTLRQQGHAGMQADVDRLIRSATGIRWFESVLIPGLLQTADYARARAIEVADLYGTPADQVDATVSSWMRRQEVIYEAGRSFEFILTEAALRFWLAPPAVMLGQLDRVLTLASLPNITLRVIPFGRQLPVTPLHGFIMAGEVTYIETLASDIVLRGEEAETYRLIADALAAEALSGDDACRAISDASAAIRSTSW